tara:strand:+ start:12578 stop:12916 length:339 start_codon:yes stop_codon:yes gene_type:complete
MMAWFLKLFKKKKAEELPEQHNHHDDDDYLGYTILDERTGMLLSVLMVCGCGNAVVKLNPESEEYFYCDHCDRVCTRDTPCEACVQHMLFDAEAVRAAAKDFQHDEDEDEDY